eukprot:CAMPEP_0174266136 /NCGR_PEP_ID=MMETSP0439-20130205/29105_1 /TAXON_ID=0 /ORGANISM="Stereomyxa ramosa, Strain Chinc5" /LENGTH=168 /DNA_ID=CAMNT_0015352927 /DNA_START=371 /DNA_END=877 /DNA_ORIENTATION=-
MSDPEGEEGPLEFLCFFPDFAEEDLADLFLLEDLEDDLGEQMSDPVETSAFLCPRLFFLVVICTSALSVIKSASVLSVLERNCFFLLSAPVLLFLEKCCFLLLVSALDTEAFFFFDFMVVLCSRWRLGETITAADSGNLGDRYDISITSSLSLSGVDSAGGDSVKVGT